MESQSLAGLLEPFFTTKEVGKGSGLGLAQVYGFARSAGGDVSIQSKVGVGTTVNLYFPRSSDAASEEAQATSSKVPLRRAASGETVLLVEDDEQVLDMAIGIGLEVPVLNKTYRRDELAPNPRAVVGAGPRD